MRLLLSPTVLLLVVTLSWAGNVIVGRAFHPEIPPLTLTFGRWGVAALAMLPFTIAGMWAHRALIARHWRLLTVLAATGVASFHACLYIAVTTTTAINAGILYSLMPLAIPASSYLMYRERLSGRQALGIAVSFVGMTIIVTRADLEALLSLSLTPGDLWMLGVVASWAVYSPLLKRLPAGLPPMTMLMTITLIGLVLLAPLYAWEIAAMGGIDANVENVMALLFIGVIGSVLAYFCWNKAVALVGANRAIVFIYLIPVFTVLMAMGLLGEAFRTYHAAGAAVIVLGIYLVMSARTPAGVARPAPPQP